MSLAASLLQATGDDLEALLEVPCVGSGTTPNSLPVGAEDESYEVDEEHGTPSSAGARVPAAQVLTDSVNLVLLEQLYHSLSASKEKRVPPPTLPPSTPAGVPKLDHTSPCGSPMSAAVSPPPPLRPVDSPVSLMASPPRGVHYEDPETLECDQILSSVKTTLASVGSSYSPHPEIKRIKKELAEFKICSEEAQREQDFLKDELGMAQSVARKYKNLAEEQQSKIDLQQQALNEAAETSFMMQEAMMKLKHDKDQAEQRQAQAELELNISKSEVASSKRLLCSHMSIEDKEAKIKSAEQMLKHTMASHEGLLKDAEEEEVRSVKLKKKLETAQELISTLKEELRIKDAGLSEMSRMKEKLSTCRIATLMNERSTVVLEEKQARGDLQHEQAMCFMEVKATEAASRAAFYQTVLGQELRESAELEAKLLTTVTSKDKAVAVMMEMQQAHSMVQAETDSTKRQLMTGNEMVWNEVTDLRDQTAALRRKLEEANDKILEKEEVITTSKKKIAELQRHGTYSKKSSKSMSPGRVRKGPTTVEALKDAMDKMARTRPNYVPNPVAREKFPYRPFYNDSGWVHAPGRATSTSPRRSMSPRHCQPPPMPPVSPPQVMLSIERESSTASLSTMSADSTPCARGTEGMPSPMTYVQRIGIVSPAPHPVL